MTTPEPSTDAPNGSAQGTGGVNGDVVTIEVPADVAYVSTLRLTAASLAARCDLTVDDIEDLRLAVDEAIALLLPHAHGTAAISARFELSSGRLVVETSVPSHDTADADREGFGWTVLGALTSSVDVQQRDGSLVIALTKNREAAQR